MYIAVSCSGLDDHEAILEEEKKQAAQLGELLEFCCSSGQRLLLADPAMADECRKAFDKAEEGIRYRARFLEHLKADVRRRREETDRILEGI